MKKRTIRCHFTDFWTKDITETFWYKVFLAPSNDIIWDNRNPDFNFCDYAISLSPVILGDRVFRLYNDDEAYLEKLNSPFWPYGESLEAFKTDQIEKHNAFMQHIFDQPLEQARRRTLYGWNRQYTFTPYRSLMAYYLEFKSE